MKLLIMAAGLGSRYGGLKQIDSFGPNGETIMDYAIYDAIQSGFGEVIFIIQENMINDLYEKFDHAFEGKIKISHVIQSSEIEFGNSVISRKKPWGTAHAILSAKDVIHGPFAVINADDYYGPKAFRQMADFLSQSNDGSQYALVGYRLGNTLSESGHVARGICKSDNKNYLVSITEKTKIQRKGDQIINLENDEKEFLLPETIVSMNCWAFMPSIFMHIESEFNQFLIECAQSDSAELYIPNVLNGLINNGVVNIRIIESIDSWFGVTYQNDKMRASVRIEEMISSDTYPQQLWS